MKFTNYNTLKLWLAFISRDAAKNVRSLVHFAKCVAKLVIYFVYCKNINTFNFW